MTLQDTGTTQPDVFDLIMRVLSRGLNKATVISVTQQLYHFKIAAGTPILSYLAEPRLLVSNVHCSGVFTSDDTIMQLAVKGGGGGGR